MPDGYGLGLAVDSALRSRLERQKADIRVAIIGAGAMGRGLLHQCRITPGVRCVAIADVKVDKAVGSCEMTAQAFRRVASAGDVADAIRGGQVAVTDDAMLLTQCDLVDVLIEASSSIVAAAEYAIAALRTGKHLVLMNAEVDLAFGPYLMDLARRHGVVYTSCGGDQHGVIKLLVDEIRLWGFDLVMAGNIKGFRTNVVAYAKRPLRRSELLDGIGGFACYGLIENCTRDAAPGLPICLAEGVVLKRDIPQDGRIALEDIKGDSDRLDFRLYAQAEGLPQEAP